MVITVSNLPDIAIQSLCCFFLFAVYTVDAIAEAAYGGHLWQIVWRRSLVYTAHSYTVANYVPVGYRYSRRTTIEKSILRAIGIRSLCSLGVNGWMEVYKSRPMAAG